MVDNALDLYFDFGITHRIYMYFSYNTMIIFFTLFVSQVLEVKRTMPWLNFILKLSQAAAFIAAGLAWYDPNLFAYTYYTVLLVSVLMLFVAAYASLLGKSSARLLTMGLVAFLSGVLIVNLMNFGLIDASFFSYNAHLFGSLIEMVIFSVALFRRVLILNEVKQTHSLARLKSAQNTKIMLEKNG
tara:strand:- start:66 stop:623 length:558 start_codon:yes stop_codon:yes gene_type:complete